MKVNTKIRYGLRTMMEIGCPQNKAGIHQKDIAINQQLSEKYLDPIIASLKASGLIANVAGKKSGYVLHKPINKITALDVFRSFEHGPEIVPCINNPKCCSKSKKCAPREFWLGLNDLIKSYLQSVSLESICSRCGELKEKKKAVTVRKKPTKKVGATKAKVK